MKFKVPKFLDRETKILTFLTFKQLALVGIAGLIVFILYYIIPIGWFFLCAAIIVAIVFSLLFIRIEGIPLAQLITQSFTFITGSKKFMWQKRQDFTPVKIIEKQEEKKEEEQAPLKVAPESKLSKLSSKIDLGM